MIDNLIYQLWIELQNILFVGLSLGLFAAVVNGCEKLIQNDKVATFLECWLNDYGGRIVVTILWYAFVIAIYWIIYTWR